MIRRPVINDPTLSQSDYGCCLLVGRYKKNAKMLNLNYSIN